MSAISEIRTENSPIDGLSFLHQRLEAHFARLRERRDAHANGAPIFALEHGLSDDELALLETEVRSAVRRGYLPRDSWLPFIVYAAEVGYAYSGDEYWQTFESCTPGWAQRGDRHYIRRKYQEFKQRFGGAEPTGAWAQHFSIICWPITHAVLPTDLQRQLARLLFDYRHAVTADLLRDPAEFGNRLAARSWQASSRFQAFAQNSALLGQVAAALLTHEDEESPYLLESTLKRIVADLSKEREARGWLRDARSSATYARMHGLASQRPARAGRAPTHVLRPPPTDPEVFIRDDGSCWTVYLQLPDLSVLAERLPAAHEELARLRARIAGVAGPPLARGRLLYPEQQLRLTTWPTPGTPLIQLENGSAAVNSLLADQCTLAPGPRWLFRIRDSLLAVEVRSKIVRPGRRYVLLSEDVLPVPPAAWCVPATAMTTGIHAYALDIPAVLEGCNLDVLRSMGLGAATDVEVSPAGLVPALWDGEGRGEWMAGESPVISVSSSRQVVRCIVNFDGHADLIPWPIGEQHAFLRLSDLDIGIHNLRVSLFSADLTHPFADGSLEIVLRPPPIYPQTGTLREGLMMLPTPANPTLTELWDGKAVVEVLGPEETQVDITVSLNDRSNRLLASQHGHATLPIETQAWTELFENHIRQAKEIQRRYDEAESCLVTASHPNLGAVSLHCEREFSPLRWAAGADQDGPFVRLIDNMEGVETNVEFFEFLRPDKMISVKDANGAPVRNSVGGLVSARNGDICADVILPPHVRNFQDLSSLAVPPCLAPGPRSLAEVLRLIDLARAWATASLPADPFAQRQRLSVLRGIVGHLVSLVGGQRWAYIEQRIVRDEDSISASELGAGVGDQPYQRALVQDIRSRIVELGSLRPEGRAHFLSGALPRNKDHARIPLNRDRVAEYLLRLASAPESLTAWPVDEKCSFVQIALDYPWLIRVARFMVVMIHLLDADDTWATYGGWAWE